MEEGKDLFSAAPECRTRSNGLLLQEWRFQLNTKKNSERSGALKTPSDLAVL